MDNTDDLKILEGILAGDDTIITVFYKQNLPYIRRYIMQNSGNEEDVSDVFQDALIMVYEKLSEDSLEITTTLRSYFYGICKNLWRSRLRKNKKLVINNTIVQSSESVDNSILQDIENREQAHLYRKYFSTLSHACREVLELIFIGKSMREIAETIGYTEGYTRKKKFECKKYLIERIENDPIYQELTEVPKNI